MFDPSPKSSRITSLLVPTKLDLFGSTTPDAFSDLVDLASTLSSPLPLLRVGVLALQCPAYDNFLPWTGLLRFTDPVHFQLWTGDDEDHQIPPSVRFVPSNFVDEPFATYWTRLETVASIGPESVLLVEGTTSTSSFEAAFVDVRPTVLSFKPISGRSRGRASRLRNPWTRKIFRTIWRSWRFFRWTR